MQNQVDVENLIDRRGFCLPVLTHSSLRQTLAARSEKRQNACIRILCEAKRAEEIKITTRSVWKFGRWQFAIKFPYSIAAERISRTRHVSVCMWRWIKFSFNHLSPSETISRSRAPIYIYARESFPIYVPQARARSFVIGFVFSISARVAWRKFTKLLSKKHVRKTNYWQSYKLRAVYCLFIHL